MAGKMASSEGDGVTMFECKLPNGYTAYLTEEQIQNLSDGGPTALDGFMATIEAVNTAETTPVTPSDVGLCLLFIQSCTCHESGIKLMLTPTSMIM